MIPTTSEGCTINSFHGTYYRIGKIVFFEIGLNIAPKATDGFITITVLPYPTMNHTAFTVGYCSAVFKVDPSSSELASGVGAGCYSNSNTIYLTFNADGRTWSTKSSCLYSAGDIVISGTYLTNAV